METVYQDYHTKDVQFFYVYKHVQHPEINNYVSAFSIKERIKHIAEAKRMFKTKFSWICDSMDNDLRRAMGRAINAEFVIDPEGKIVRKRFWSDPSKLRKDLEELVGPSEKITTVDEMPTKFVAEKREIASGVVPRLKLPGGLAPLKVIPDLESEHPFFAKLRMESTSGLFTRGKGKLYLGVYLDPLYKVHWNNRAGKVLVEIDGDKEMTFSETKLESPSVKEDADVDPRQFLVEIDRGRSLDPFQVKLTYTVCDDKETFCQKVTQSYEVHIEPNREMGSRPGIFMPKMFANTIEYDRNGDGNITKNELPAGKKTLYIGHMDFNGNEVIEKEELEMFNAMFNNGRGFESAKNDGG